MIAHASSRSLLFGFSARCHGTASHTCSEIKLLRAGLSPGAHFREALRARSKAEYVAKLNGGVMELEETLYWLELLAGIEVVAADDVEPLTNEAEQLIAIFLSLINKWKP